MDTVSKRYSTFLDSVAYQIPTGNLHKSDSASSSSLGAAAKERTDDAKPVKTVREIIAGLSLDKLENLRSRLGSLPHSRLLQEVQGRSLLFWLAAVDRELGIRASAHV